MLETPVKLKNHYMTTNSDEVVLLHVIDNDASRLAVIGLLRKRGTTGWGTSQWSTEGLSISESHSLDLVEVDMPGHGLSVRRFTLSAKLFSGESVVLVAIINDPSVKFPIIGYTASKCVLRWTINGACSNCSEAYKLTGTEWSEIDTSGELQTALKRPARIFERDDNFLYGVVEFEEDREVHKWHLNGKSTTHSAYDLRAIPAAFDLNSEVCTRARHPVVLWNQIGDSLYGAYFSGGEWEAKRWSTLGEAIYEDEDAGYDLVHITKSLFYTEGDIVEFDEEEWIVSGVALDGHYFISKRGYSRICLEPASMGKRANRARPIFAV
jgi:hypothetical protein